MSWSSPAFGGGVAWQDYPVTTTPLTAAELNSSESLLASYATSVGQSVVDYWTAALGVVVAAPTGVAATDTAAWHTARDTAGPNGIVLGRAGNYVVNGLNATSSNQIWRGMPGSSITMANATNAPLITATAPIMLDSLTLDGNKANNSGGSNVGVWLNNGSTGSVIRNCTIKNTYGNGILNYVAPVLIQGNTFTDVRTQALFAQPGVQADMPDIRVLDNTVDKSMQAPATAIGYGIQLHGGPASRTFTANTTSGSVTLAAVSSFTSLANGVSIQGTGIAIGATIASFDSVAGTVTMSMPATATGTTVTVTVNYALRGLVVARNKILLPLNATSTMIGIECWGWTPGAIVAENRCYGGYMGISLDRSDNGTVTGNNCEASSAIGIEVANCTNVTVNGNTVDGSMVLGGGITLDGQVVPSTKCTIAGNAITRITNKGGTAGKGIYIITNGDHCVIVGNTLTVNTGATVTGVYIQNSPSTAVLCNVLYCYSTASFDAITFEGSSATGGAVMGNVIEGWPRSAVTLYTGSNGSTSAALSTAAAITSIPVTALGGAIPAGTVWIGSGANSQSQSFTTTGAAAGATSIPVTSQTPNFAYPSGSTITIVSPVIDRIVIGPNVFNSNGAILTPNTAAVIGGRCRFVYAEQSQLSPNVSAVTVGASPFTYTNNDHAPEMLYITGGTVSAVNKNGVNIFTASPCAFLLEPGEAVTVTYSVAPTINKDIS